MICAPPKSPHNLIQESLWENPWKIFVACIFCNLTKRIHAEPYIWNFFEKYPDPESASKADTLILEKMIMPLGLSQRRAKALITMSHGYTRLNWQDKPSVLYGIGKYASDAYLIFCQGRWRDTEPTDHALKNYVNWLRTRELENEHICS